MADDTIPRRLFLKGAGAAGTTMAAALASGSPAAAGAKSAPASASTTAVAPSASTPVVDTFLTLTPTEVAFLEAVADTLIPADELSSSGTACGCVVFIDRQLASAWGAGSKTYRSGPFLKGTPEQGYQLPLAPREYFAVGIAAANEWSRKTLGRDFDRLATADRVAALTAMEEGKAEFANFSARAFFDRLLTMTLEGFFSDPLYGGNRDKASWKMLGFPGLPATYSHLVDDYHSKRYSVSPQSIVDFS